MKTKKVLLDASALLMSLMIPNGYSCLCLHYPGLYLHNYISQSTLEIVTRTLTSYNPKETRLHQRFFLHLWPNTTLLPNPNSEDQRPLRTIVPKWFRPILASAITSQCEFLITMEKTLLQPKVKLFAKRHGIRIIQPSLGLLNNFSS